MPTPAKNEPALDILLADADGGVAFDEKLGNLNALRNAHPDQSPRIDHFLLTHLSKAREGLGEAGEKLDELAGMIEKLTAFPWHIATYAGPVATPGGTRARGLHGTTQRGGGSDDQGSIDQ